MISISQCPINSSYAPPAETSSHNENNFAVQNVAVHAKRDSGMYLSKVFSDMANCSIGRITVNGFSLKKTEKEIEEEFDF